MSDATRDGAWWAERLEVARGHAPEDYHAGCPSCGSRDNLHVTNRPGRDALLKCYSGCEYDDILAATEERQEAAPVRVVRRGRRGRKASQERTNQTTTIGKSANDPIAWLASYCAVEPALVAELPVEARGDAVAFLFGSTGVAKLRTAGAKTFEWQPAKGASPPIWPLPGKELETQLVLCEGEMDAICLRAAGWDAYSVTKGSSGPPPEGVWRQLRERGLRRVVLVYDEDKDGYKGREAAAEEIRAAAIEPVFARIAGLDVVAGEKDARDVWLRAGELDLERTGGLAVDREIDAADLIAADLPPVRFIVPDLLPDGTTVLAAPPKIGKSWMGYQLAVEVSLGGEFLGRSVERGAVLHYPLEEGPVLGQARLRAALHGRPFPRGRYTVRWAAPLLGQGLEEELREWVEGTPEPALVIIDTLQKVRPAASGRRNAYEVDVEDLGRIQAVFRDTPVALVVVHHTRKQGSDDFVTKVSGTFGLSGSADTVWTLLRKRHDPSGLLDMTSRKAFEQEIDVSFDPQSGIWTALPTGMSKTSPLEVTIYGWLKEHGPARTGDVAEALEDEHNYEAVKKELQRMHAAGTLQRQGTKYAVGEVKVTRRKKENPNG